ncbi:NADPH:quinone oxidoreductase family protein [Tardiphaga sp. P9-11]|uniref:NADPH:quinone oxidoreductase family protein n=1 Tax=Tardiphaga sp. P9-11 TaxID=2024614 RepID=UPI0018D5E9DA|nr:NADPH:quinone oxidoreductase family protein [Tardiphaga sp. P9-11]
MLFGLPTNLGGYVISGDHPRWQIAGNSTKSKAESMRALVSYEPGGPDTLRLASLPDPVPASGQLLVSIAACGVNFPDLLMIQDLYQVKAPRPFAPGAEIAGTVVALGEGISGFKVGDRVAARCGTGGMAEMIAIDAARCTKIPDTMPFRDAAAFQFTYETAYYALVTRGRLKQNETVLVLGAAGGVGSASIQVAKALGARVVAATSSEEKLAFALSQGADHGLVYQLDKESEDPKKELARAMKVAVGRTGADLIIDPVGGFAVEPAMRCAAEGARYLILGFTAGIAAMPMNLPLLKSCDVLGINWRTFTLEQPLQSAANRAQLLEFYAARKIAPAITATFALEEGQAAISAFKDRSVLGKIVVLIAG